MANTNGPKKGERAVIGTTAHRGVFFGYAKDTGGETISLRRGHGPKKGERAVLVTTAHRGVFFGYAKDTDGETISLRRGRCCVYWSTDLRGFIGLASNGPGNGCKIGPAADIELRAITAVVEVSPEAVEKWEAGPWK